MHIAANSYAAFTSSVGNRPRHVESIHLITPDPRFQKAYTALDLKAEQIRQARARDGESEELHSDDIDITV